jgi:RNA polymerase sigma-70 factor (sigma-E family)
MEAMAETAGAPAGEPAPGDLPTASLGELFEERYAAMVRVATLLTGSNEAAEDLVQDTFIRLQRGWHHIEHPRAYLRKAVVNACRSWHRRRALERRHPPGPPAQVSLEACELADALQALPYRQRAAIVLRFYEDRPEAEIAQLLGCRRGTVASLLHRGLATLRERIE